MPEIGPKPTDDVRCVVLIVLISEVLWSGDTWFKQSSIGGYVLSIGAEPLNRGYQLIVPVLRRQMRVRPACLMKLRLPLGAVRSS